MKQIKCEMCGSPDLIKQDGVFVCRICGSSFSPEKAKRPIPEGAVEVQGALNADDDAFLRTCLANARRALNKHDWEAVERYYNTVQQAELNNMEAAFFCPFAQTMRSLAEAELCNCRQKFDILCASQSVINEYYEVSGENKRAALMQISRAIAHMYDISEAYNQQTTAKERKRIYAWMCKVRKAYINELKKIQEAHPEEKYIQELIDENSARKKRGERLLYCCCRLWLR